MTTDADSSTPAMVAAGIVGAAATLAGKHLVARLTGGRIGSPGGYNVAKVTVSGPIQRSRSRSSSLSGRNACIHMNFREGRLIHIWT